MPGKSPDDILSEWEKSRADGHNDVGDVQISPLHQEPRQIGWDKICNLLPACPFGADFEKVAQDVLKWLDEPGHIEYDIFSITTSAPWQVTITISGMHDYQRPKRVGHEYETRDEALVAMAYMAKATGKGIAKDKCGFLRRYLREKGIEVKPQVAPLVQTNAVMDKHDGLSSNTCKGNDSVDLSSSASETISANKEVWVMNDHLRSLLFYLAVKHMSSVTRDVLSEHYDDYGVFLSDIVSLAVNIFDIMRDASFVPMERYRGNLPDQLIPLGQIVGVTREQYQSLLDMIFNRGERPVPGPNPEPPVPPPSWYEDYIRSMSSEEERCSLREDVDAIYSRIMANVDPRHPDRLEANGVSNVECVEGLMNTDCRDRASGLVVGRVQSGKTRNYIGLALKAFVDGWNVVIILTSNNTALAWQTKERLDESILSRAPDRIHALYTFESIADGLSWRNDAMFGGDGKYLGLALKEKHHLEDIETWLRDTVGEDGQHRMRILVIDDESDSSTPDTQNARGLIMGEREFEQYLQSFPQKDDLAADDASWIVGDWLEGLRSGLRLFDGVIEDAGQIPEGIVRGVAEKIVACLGDNEMADRLAQVFPLEDKRLYDEIVGIGDALGMDLSGEIAHGQRCSAREAVGTYVGGGNRRRRQLCAALRFLFGAELSRSTINRAMCRIVSRTQRDDFVYRFERAAYVGYTATPVANLVNEGSRKNPIAADFAYSMHVPSKYFGFEKIFGSPADGEAAGSNMPIICMVRDVEEAQNENREKTSIIDPLQAANGEHNAFPPPGQKINEDLDLINTEDGSVVCRWESLKDAICWTFCTAAARTKAWRSHDVTNDGRDVHRRWTTMLINLNRRIDMHRGFQQWIYAYLRKVRDNEEGARQGFLSRCERVWNEQTRQFTREMFVEKFPRYGAPADYPTWDELRVILDNDYLTRMTGGVEHRDLGRVHVCNVNSDSDDNPAYNGRDNLALYKQGPGAEQLRDCHIWILCGGNTISRGLTLDGLTASYFNRIGNLTPSDTITQMGRWFGYRVGYELLPRAWMTEDTVREMKTMCREEAFLHRKIRESFDAGRSPKNDEHAIEILQSVSRVASSRMAAFLTTGVGFNSPSQTFNVLKDSADARRLFVERLNEAMGTYDIRRYQLHGARNCLYFAGIPSRGAAALARAVADAAAVSAQGDVGLLTREVGRFGGQCWDLAINSSQEGNFERRDLIGNLPDICIYSQRGAVTAVGEIGFKRIQNNSYQGNFGGVDQRVIDLAECRLVEKKIGEPFWTAFPAEYPSRDRLLEHIRSVRENDQLRLAASVHDFEPFGLSRRSSTSYRDEVFAVYRSMYGQDHNPILQITFIKPPAGLVQGDEPFAVASYYWPGHHIDGFVIGSNRPGRNNENVSDARYIAEQISHILDELHFANDETIWRQINMRAGDGNRIDQAGFNVALRYRRSGYGCVGDDMLNGVKHNVYYSQSWCPAREEFYRRFQEDVMAFVDGNGVDALRVDERMGGVLRPNGWDRVLIDVGRFQGNIPM